MADDEILKCVGCGKQTTRLEAEVRTVRTGYCGHCGASLVALDRCGAVRRLPLEPEDAICLAPAGHSGPHRGTVEW